MRHAGILALLPFSITIPSCASTIELGQLDQLARSTGARAVLLEEDLSLYSPYDWVTTRQHLEQLRAQRDLVFGLLELERGAPLLVWLRPDPGMRMDVAAEGDVLRVGGFRAEPEHGVLGRAGRDRILIQVDPPAVLQLDDGRILSSSFHASRFEETLRHELAHVAAARLGIRPASWLSEGFAHFVEWNAVEEGHVCFEHGHEKLRSVAELPRERRRVDRLLAWRQSHPPTEEDRVIRLLSYAFVAFALERQPGPSLRSRLESLARTEPAALRALEPEWSAWLDRRLVPGADLPSD